MKKILMCDIYLDTGDMVEAGTEVEVIETHESDSLINAGGINGLFVLNENLN